MHTRRRRTHRLATFWLDCNCRHAAHGNKSHSRCQPIHRLRKTAGAIQRASNLRLECSKMYCPLEDMESQHAADSVRWVQCLRACVNCTRRIGNCPLQHDRPERDSAARKPCHVLCFPSSAAGHCWPVSRRCGSYLRRRRPPCRKSTDLGQTAPCLARAGLHIDLRRRLRLPSNLHSTKLGFCLRSHAAAGGAPGS